MLTGLNSLIYWKEKHIQKRMDVSIANSKARDADHAETAVLAKHLPQFTAYPE